MFFRILRNPIFIIGLVSVAALVVAIFAMAATLSERVAAEMSARLGRSFTAQQTHFSIWPTPQIILSDVTVAGVSSMAEPALTVKAFRVPVSVQQLFTDIFAPDTIFLDQPQLNLIVNSAGHSNVMIEAEGADIKNDRGGALAKPIHVIFTDGRLKYVDETKNVRFLLQAISGSADVGGQSVLTSQGSLDIADQHAVYSISIASLARAFGEGSPLDLNVEAAGSSFGFSGRVVAASGLDLAGQATLDASDGSRLFKWLGVKLGGLQTAQKFLLRGAMESQGPVFLMKNADVRYGTMAGNGNFSFSGAGVRPNITAAMTVGTLDLNNYGDGKTALNVGAGWSDTAFDLADLNAVDAQFHVAADTVKFGKLTAGKAILEGAVKDGALQTKISSAALSNGSGTIEVKLDGHEAVAQLQMNFDVASVDALPLLQTFTGQSWLAGPLTLKAQLTSHGQSTAAMIGNLSGQVDASLQNGDLVGADLEALAKLAITNPVNGWNGKLTSGVSGHAASNVADGIVSLGETQFTTANSSITASGEVDVLRQALALESDVTMTGGKPTKYHIDGPWATPKITGN